MNKELKLNIVYNMDCLEGLKQLPDNSIDSCVTDPPYGLSKDPNIAEVLTHWLNDTEYKHPSKGFMGKEWDSFVPAPTIWKEVYRVLKPGGHVLCFAGTRTQDLMTLSLRIAGFEIRDVIEWLYFSGFSKSNDIGNKINKKYKDGSGDKWIGWGTQLKPAHEPIVMARKPVVNIVIDNVRDYSIGGLNLDGCRIPIDKDESITTGLNNKVYELGRFPSNCITTENEQFYSKYFNISPKELSHKATQKDKDSNWKGEKIEGESKQVRRLSGGKYKNNSGWESDKNGTSLVNNHPSPKPTDLMSWLIKLVTPPNGIVLDPFAGSGSTLVAAKREGFDYIGYEMENEYIEIIHKRLC